MGNQRTSLTNRNLSDHRYVRFYISISENVEDIEMLSEVLLTGSKVQVKIPSHSGVYADGRETFYTLSLRTKGLRDIGHNMGMVLETKKSIFMN